MENNRTDIEKEQARVMKVLFVSHDDGKYGAAQCMMALVDYLKKNKDVIPIVTTRCKNEFNQFCQDRNIEYYVLPYVSCVTYYSDNKWRQKYFCIKQNLKNIICNFISIQLLKRRVDLRTIDVTYTNVSTINFGVVLGQKYNIPNFWHIREYGLGSALVSRRNTDLANAVNKVFAISNGVRDHWISKGISEKKIITIYDGVDQSNIVFDANKVFNIKELKIVFIGSAAPIKGIEQLIDAIGLMRDIHIENMHLDIYGDYTNKYGQSIKRYVRQHRLDKFIYFKGFVHNLNEVLFHYDIGVVCTEAEGFGRVTVEYMSAGVVVVASNTGANVELIQNGINGFLYSYGDSKDLMNKITKLCENPAIMQKMSIDAHSSSQRYCVDNNGEQIYNEIINNI